jgi:type II secretory pathway component PulM
LAKKKPSMSEILKANRQVIIVLLSFPIAGMFIAMGLIWYKRPGNMLVALGAILFLLVQYSLLVYFLIKRIDSLSKNSDNNDSEDLLIK